MVTRIAAGRQDIPTGVIFNAYPDSIGDNLAHSVALLGRPELRDAFSLFYVLPTFFNSDLDRGFSIIDYGLNGQLVSPQDLEGLRRLGIELKLDLVANHLSVASPQFRDLLARGDDSEYRDFFIDWNEFWRAHGRLSPDGHIVPRDEFLQKLFMRKPGLPILKVRFPDGSARPYWNTFYQKVSYGQVSPADFQGVPGVGPHAAGAIAALVNSATATAQDLASMDLDGYAGFKNEILAVAESKRIYLGQMDLNAESEKVWDFYDRTLGQLRGYGARVVRLDAFAYLHKKPGETNFFNRPGTWDYLDRLKGLARRHDLIILPEIHAQYGSGLHADMARNGFPIYDFFFPGLVIDALDRGTNRHLLRWIRELTANGIRTINMLGCHDGIPAVDLRGAEVDGAPRPGLLGDGEIEALIDRVIKRGGRVKDLYGPDGRRISYYQVNATFYSALGEDDRKLLLARALQMFMPGTPQVWYLDLFAGRNDHAAADNGGPAGHKEINRTNLSVDQVEDALRQPVVQDQLSLIRLRNTSPAFRGELGIHAPDEHTLHLAWRHDGCTADLKADLRDHAFTITHEEPGRRPEVHSYR